MNIVELINIEKSYDNNVILDEISITIEEGEMVALTGESGRGKSTLLNVIGLIEDYDYGEYSIVGKKNIKPNTLKARRIIRNNIGYIFQNYALIETETVEYNLNIALKYTKYKKKEKRKLISDTLKVVNLESKLKEKVFKLSGGEQQRIAIARVMLKPSRIIIADEPTGSLDNKNRDIVMELIKNLNKEGKTVIIATHDPYVISKCNKVIEL